MMEKWKKILNLLQAQGGRDEPTENKTQRWPLLPMVPVSCCLGTKKFLFKFLGTKILVIKVQQD